MADYSICKCIRTDKPVKRNGKYPIYLRIRVGNKETKIPVGLDIKKELWDSKKREPKNKALLILLNRKVVELEHRIYKSLVEGQEISLEAIKDFSSGKKKTTKTETKSLYEYYLEFVERKRKEGLNPETIRVYMTTYNVLKSFKKKLYLSDISLSFVEKFDDYMREVNGNSAGGRNPKHKNLRSFILDLQKHDILVNNPYKWFKIPSPNTKEIYLDKTELNTLIDYTNNLARDSKEYKILKMYLFSCYCGLRFSDVITLTWKDVDLENLLIRKTMIKTKTDVITPLFPKAYDILMEWSKNSFVKADNERIFHNYSEPTINNTLRLHTKLAGINKHITYHSRRHSENFF